MQDVQIIELFLARDESAIAEVDKVYRSYCLAIAERILDNREDAEEVVSDTWLRVWETVPPARPMMLKQYLAKITRNLAFDVWRTKNAQKRGEGRNILALEELGQCIPSGCTLEDHWQAQDLRSAINRFLKTISDRDCGIFLHRYFYMEDTDLISRHYRLSEGNVLQILSRTRKKLRKFLEKEGYWV